MLEDMHMRQLAPKSQAAYIRAAYKLDPHSAADLTRYAITHKLIMG